MTFFAEWMILLQHKFNLGRSNPPLKNFNMGKFLDWLKAESAIGEVMRSQCEKAIKLRKRQIELEERIKADSVLQDHINENVLSALDAQKVANLICQQMTLVSLVKDMRKAQTDVDTFLDFGNVPECYFDRMSKLEDKVDDLLKSMEE